LLKFEQTRGERQKIFQEFGDKVDLKTLFEILHLSYPILEGDFSSAFLFQDTKEIKFIYSKINVTILYETFLSPNKNHFLYVVAI
jgi:hypothetical protein